MSSDLQNKLWHYEATPPAGAWASLAAALDQEAPAALREKLSGFEASPAPSVWSRIDQRLSSPPAPVVPFFRRYRRPLKYTSAAAIMCFVAIVLTLTVSKKSISEGSTQVTTSLSPARRGNSKARISTRSNEQTAPAERYGTGAPVPAAASSFNKREGASLRPQPIMPLHVAFTSFVPPAAPHRTIAADSRMDSYMVYTDDEGRAVRLPKKLFDAVACPTPTNVCRERLKRMQEKIAAHALNPGFSGLLDLLNQLKDNQ